MVRSVRFNVFFLIFEKYKMRRSSLEIARTQARRIASMKIPSRPVTPNIRACFKVKERSGGSNKSIPKRFEKSTKTSRYFREEVDRILKGDMRDVWDVVTRICENEGLETMRLELLEYFTSLCENEIGVAAKSALRIARTLRHTNTTNRLCKSLYLSSKSKTYDEKFYHSGVLQQLQSLLSESLKREYETVPWCESPYVSYVMGTLRNLSHSNSIQHWMAMQGGTIDCMTQMLRVRNCSSSSSNDITMLTHVLCVLRNLTVSRKHFKQFLSHDTIEIMCEHVLRRNIFQKHAECMYHVSRVLAKITLDKKCRARIRKYGDENMRAMIRVLKYHPNHRGLIIRITFVLGNMTATNDSNRKFLLSYFKNDSILSDLFERFMSVYINVLEGETEEEEKYEEIEEVLVKLVRVVANVAIDSSSGLELVSLNVCKMTIDMFCSLALKFAEKEENDLQQQQELFVFLISAMTNLSFYADGHIQNERQRICKHLVNIIVLYADHQNIDIVSESLRALGNFTRDSTVRYLVNELRGVELVVLLLNHKNIDILYSSCGVLLNFAADAELKVDIDDVAEHLFDVVDRTLFRDEDVAVVACKAMCNLALRKNGLSEFYFDVKFCERIESLVLGALESDIGEDLKAVLRHLMGLLRRRDGSLVK